MHAHVYQATLDPIVKHDLPHAVVFHALTVALAMILAMETIDACVHQRIQVLIVNWVLTFARAIHALIVVHANRTITATRVVAYLASLELDVNHQLTTVAQIHVRTMVFVIVYLVAIHAHAWPVLKEIFANLKLTIVHQVHALMVLNV